MLVTAGPVPNQCNRTTGECEGGCQPGWEGLQCNNTNKGVTQTDFIGTDSKPSSSGQGNKIIKTENKKSKKSQRKDNEADVDDDEKIHSENPYGDFYANETTIRDIPLNQLESVIVEKRMNKDDGFQREYASLPYGEQYKCDEGKREENVVKNRYKTIFPYDHSRVILRTESASGYINANYIEGAHRQNEYIAAQGPTKNTLADFWTMIWQGNVSSIVMLTNLQEGTKTKKSRSLIQYHYTAWPDYGIPDPLCLVVFLDHLTRTGTNQNSSPTVVHCSRLPRVERLSYPTVEDFVDFLYLLYDHESDIVIFMDPLSTTEPSREEDHTVTIVEPKFSINASGTPLDTSQLRYLYLVSVALGVETENLIIVVSSDGASLCSAFCAVHNVMQQINIDGNVDVFTSVRNLQVRRPEFCSSLDEYQLVNKAVDDYIQRSTENIYSN
ncbi:receptor-type tyrosine-protein phosphatase epsilon-like [Saccostrea echinata]|uniref:receptor-type tyrosine-protein phosphatase epsilon-like n=1 Tax=Saccostrea echinata TaxID=191078 RepID=UPI002A7F1F51|nr:receptor-type tyrosine-protein phosphatase epsilon-like [Saccostrea echinata]